MRRREFITLLGGATVAWPLGARAQQPAMSIVGLVNGRAAQDAVRNAAAFRSGLNETGYVENQNVIHDGWLSSRGRSEKTPARGATRRAKFRAPSSRLELGLRISSGQSVCASIIPPGDNCVALTGIA